MNEVFDLQKRGFYVALYFMPKDGCEGYIGRWDDDDWSERTDIGSFEGVVERLMAIAEEYDE